MALFIQNPEIERDFGVHQVFVANGVYGFGRQDVFALWGGVND